MANGLSTDHPVPGLAFVDDSHIPLDDPREIEAVGRHEGDDMWGRWDGHLRVDDDEPDQWRAFTTDPVRRDLAWCVRFHPERGRSVLLVHNDDASALHMDWDDEILLFRAGGYWWDGTHWYRPLQVIDWASQTFVRRKARAAVTVTAADLVDPVAEAARAAVLTVADLGPAVESDDQRGPLTVANWSDHLALWAARRPEGALPLSQCVVNISAPELAGDQLVGVSELAAMAGIEASTLRAYASRGEAELPDPQAVISGRAAWSKPVAADWVEQRARSASSVADTMASDHVDNPVASTLSRGRADIFARFTTSFLARLWNPQRRKWWALRHRNEASARQLAETLAWTVASDLDHIIPTSALATTIRCAVLQQFADDIERSRKLNREPADEPLLGVIPKVAIMLDWLVRHHPTTAGHTINEIIGIAEKRWNLPRDLVIFSLQTALSLDGKLPDGGYDTFWARIVPPKGDPELEPDQTH
ncbi:hypothetical protein [Nocardia cyriacigeorgica]|uniref:hypothetical protein n=1 Tax=Nocardia cyriacigeorgica TaxID=135487 RepID=UPI0024553EE1|nr:hypothetical protein [Nocardia cyriacigeorgica]